MIYELKDLEEESLMLYSLQNLPSILRYHKPKQTEVIVQELIQELRYNRQEKEKSVRWFVTHCTRVLKTRHKATGFFVTLNKNNYTKGTDNPQKIGYRPTITMIQDLEKKGYIDLYKGFIEERDAAGLPTKTWSSFIRLTDKCYELFGVVQEIKEVHLPVDSQFIVLKDKQTKEEIEVQYNSVLQEREEQLRNLKVILEDSDITYGGQLIAPVEYYCVYTDDHEHGGRFYAVGGGIQTVASYDRRDKIKIDGSPVVELDFKSMHPFLLLEEENQDNPEIKEELQDNFEPYKVDVSSFLVVDLDEVQEFKREHKLQSYDPVRNLLKDCLLVSMNAKRRVDAISSLRMKLMKDKKKKVHVRKRYVGLYDVQLTDVCNAIQDHNKYISKYFYSDLSHRLMNIDSCIASRVVDRMLAAEQPVLIYHDSFIVKQEAEKLLYDAMQLAWKEEVGDNQFCYIEKK